MRDRSSSTVSGLASDLGLARSTVGQRLESLERVGLIAPAAVTGGGRGRPAASWRFNAGVAVVLAAHVGMTGSRAVVANLGGEILAEEFVPVDMPRGFEASVDELGDVLDRLRRSAPIAAIGIGMPSALEYSGYRLSLGLDGEPWTPEGIRERLERRFGVPVVLGLDVALLAQSERARSWPGAEVLVGIKVGTLVDAAVVVNGVAIQGARGLAGEFGHVRVPGRDDPCSCGSRGCVDAVASGSAVARGLSTDGSAAAQVADVVRLVRRGHADAEAAVREAGRDIGAALSSIVNLLNPGVICVWGYLADSGPQLVTGMREGLYRNALPQLSDGLPIVTAAGGANAGARGAADIAIAAALEPSSVDRVVKTGTF